MTANEVLMRRAACRACAFYHQETYNDGYEQGECRRHGPTSFFLDGTRTPDGTDAGWGVWPRVAGGDWCGQFEGAAR